MTIVDILTPQRIIVNSRGDSKKRALEIISKTVAKTHEELTAKDILQALTNRERLGSTGIGHGVALPHCRVPKLTAPIAAMVKLKESINYDDDPSKPKVDLVFALLVPENADEEHLALLSHIARIFHNKKKREHIRKTKDPKQLYELFAQSPG